MEGKDNDLDEAENVTDEEGAEDTVDRVELFLLTRGAASTRRSSAMQRSVVLVVTQVGVISNLEVLIQIKLNELGPKCPFNKAMI